MKRYYRTAILSLVFVFSIVAQSVEKPSEPVIFAEFGKISTKERTAKIKAFHEVLKVCDGRKGFIYNYGTSAAIKARKKALMKDWLGCDAFNCVRNLWMDIQNGKATKTVLWIIPPGAENPTP